MIIKPLITVYITNYNYGKYIKKAINSVLKQTFKNFELIIIDDGSKDKSKLIIKKFSNHNKIITIFQQNKGLIACGNLAIKISRGKYIIRLDADDWFDQRALEILSNSLEKNNKAGLVFPDYYEVDEEGNITRQVRRHDFKKVTLFDQPAHGACTMIRKSFLNKVGNYNEVLNSQDGYDLWLKFIKKYKIININLPLFYYRQHKESLTKNEDRILASRSLIFKEKNKNKNLNRKCISIIPVRGYEEEPNSIVLKKLKNKPLLEWIVDTSLKSEKILKTIIATSDEIVIKHLKRKYKNKVLIFRRHKNLSKINLSLKQTIIQSIKFARNRNIKFYYIFNFSFRSPFISFKDIDNALNVMNFFNTDQVIGVRQENDVIYQHDGHGLKLLNKNPELKLEREILFKDVGGLRLIKSNFFKLSKKTKKIGHSVLSQKPSHSINTEIDWEIAKVI